MEIIKKFVNEVEREYSSIKIGYSVCTTYGIIPWYVNSNYKRIFENIRFEIIKKIGGYLLFFSLISYPMNPSFCALYRLL